MVNELLYAIDDAHDDEDIRAIVLTGEGKAFCAGGDFAQMTGGADGGPELPPKGDYADLLLAMMRTDEADHRAGERPRDGRRPRARRGVAPSRSRTSTQSSGRPRSTSGSSR